MHIFRCVCIWSSIFFIVYAENVHVSNDYTAINFSQDTSTFHRTADGPYHAFYDVDGTVSQICSLPLMFLFLIRISMVFILRFSLNRYTMEPWLIVLGGLLQLSRTRFNELVRPVRQELKVNNIYRGHWTF